MVKFALWALAVVASLYALILVALFAKQGALIYPAPRERVLAAELNAADPSAGFADIVLRTSDGLGLRAVFRRAQPGRRTFVFFHGNGDSLRGAAAATHALTRMGAGALLVEYRGYGANEGSPGEAGLYADGRAALAWLAEQGVAADRIVLIGNSLGSGVATQLATEFPVAGLAIVSGFTSLPDVVAAHLKWVPVRLLLRDRYDNLAKVGRLTMPLLILHGDADTLIPVEHGVALADAAAKSGTARATLLRVPGVGHDLAYQPQSAAAIGRWADALPGRPPR